MQGQALLHAGDTGIVEWGAIVPDTACRRIAATAPHPMQPAPACDHLLRTVPPLASHAFTCHVWRALLSNHRDWMEPVLEQLTAPTSRVRHALHWAWMQTDQVTDKVLDLPLKPLRVLYPQAHIPLAGTSNRLARLGLQHRVQAAHAGGVVEQPLTLRNPSTAQGHWYLHQLLFLPQAAPKHRLQEPYDTHPECLGAQSFPQLPPPALPQGQGKEALLQGPLLHATTAVQQRGRRDAGGAELDRRNCRVVACTPACRHLVRDTTELRPYQPTYRTVLASTVAAVTMGPMAAWPARLLHRIPCQGAWPRQPAATHAPTAPLTAEQVYATAAALLPVCGESFVHHHGPTQITGSIQGPQRHASQLWRATLRERTRIRDANSEPPPPGPQQMEALVMQAARYQAILHGHTGGYQSNVLAEGKWTIWHDTTRQGAFPPQVDWRQEPDQAYYMAADPLAAGSAAAHHQQPKQTA